MIARRCPKCAGLARLVEIGYAWWVDDDPVPESFGEIWRCGPCRHQFFVATAKLDGSPVER
jgi:hypothetical protein